MAEKIKLTPAQERAASLRGRSVLVSAAAGAGKTRVLVERLLRQVTDPAERRNADEFLLITYTNAAAGEMRSRILSRLGDLLEENPSDAHLQAQAARVHGAHIGTLHAYCMELYKEFGAAAGLPTGLRVGGEVELRMLHTLVCDQTLEAVFDEYEDSEPEDGLEGLLRLGLSMRGDRKLVSLVESAREKMAAQPDPEKWREACLELSVPELWEGFLLGMAEAAFSAPDLEPEMTVDKLQGAIAEGWDALYLALREAKAPSKSPLQKLLESWREVVSMDFETACRATQENLPVLQALIRLVVRFDKDYADEKKARRLMDYRDMERFALAVLRDETGGPSPAARLVSGRFCEIMVDEYQDINPLQDAIIDLLSRNGENVFYVGDIRQSIYRFQNAEPGLFLRRYNQYPEDAESGPVKVLLTENFRSRQGVLDCVNHVFSRIMTEKSGEVRYTEPLVCGREDYKSAPGDPPALELLMADPACEEERLTSDGDDKAMREPRVIARRLRELVDTGTFRPGQCAILLRSPGTHARRYRKALMEQGLACDITETQWLDSPEVLTLTALLTVMDNPLQDIYLLTLLRSPLYAFENGQLAALVKIKASHWLERLKKGEESAEDESLRQACESVCQALDRWRFLASEFPVRRLIERVAAETDLARLIGGGAEDRIDAFAAMAEASGAADLPGFLAWLAVVREENKPPITPDSPPSEAVRLLSIHKSKGLEFPLVVLAELEKPFNLKDSWQTVLVHAKQGLAAKHHDGQTVYPTPPHHCNRLLMQWQTRAEELRLLYVA